MRQINEQAYVKNGVAIEPGETVLFISTSFSRTRCRLIEVLTMAQASTTIKKDTNFDIGRQFCSECQTWRFFYRMKETEGPWFCQICNSNVESVECAYKKGDCNGNEI